jgi:HK97 family phage prohead protease
MKDIEKKFVRFDCKAMSDSGEFSGIASTYGNKDLGGDVIERGAFTKTLAERGSDRPLLWQHRADSPIGVGTFRDSEEGLLIEKGRLLLALPDGLKAYTVLREGCINGLSIGFEAIKWEWKRADDPDAWPIRHVKEARLWETSVVTFPMNEQAVVTSVKSIDPALIQFFADELAAGREISPKNQEILRAANANLTALLAKAAAAPKHTEPAFDHSASIAIVEKMLATIRS